MAKILMKDGTEAQARLTFKDLYDLEKNNSKLAEEYFEIQDKEKLNELDMIRIIRIAYICAGNQEVTFEEFLEKISQNRNQVLTVYYELLYPKN